MPLAPAAVGIILNADQTQVLLVKRQDVPVWVLPGGGIDLHETPENAVVREIEEETGFLVKILHKCAEYTPVNRLSSFTTVFVCTRVAGEASPSQETTEVTFFSLAELPKTFFPPHHQWLNEALSHTTCIKRPLTEVSYYAALKYFLKHPEWVFRYAWTRLTK